MDVTKTPKTARQKDIRREAWKIVSNLIVPILFVLLIPVGVTVGVIQHENVVHDRRAAANDRRITAIALWDRYDNDLAGCGRGNIVRAHQQSIDSAVKAVNEILAAFLDTSVQFRKAAGQNAAARQALAARNEIKRIAGDIVPITPIDCDATIVKPNIPRPKEKP